MAGTRGAVVRFSTVGVHDAGSLLNATSFLFSEQLSTSAMMHRSTSATQKHYSVFPITPFRVAAYRLHVFEALSTGS